jgi:hypothetical protein
MGRRYREWFVSPALISQDCCSNYWDHSIFVGGPLHFAACWSTSEAVQYLIEQKCDVNQPNDNKRTPLQCLVTPYSGEYGTWEAFRSVRVLRVLLQSGADITSIESIPNAQLFPYVDDLKVWRAITSKVSSSSTRPTNVVWPALPYLSPLYNDRLYIREVRQREGSDVGTVENPPPSPAALPPAAIICHDDTNNHQE